MIMHGLVVVNLKNYRKKLNNTFSYNFQCWANTWATFDRIWCFPQAALESAEELRGGLAEAFANTEAGGLHEHA